MSGWNPRMILLAGAGLLCFLVVVSAVRAAGGADDEAVEVAAETTTTTARWGEPLSGATSTTRRPVATSAPHRASDDDDDEGPGTTSAQGSPLVPPTGPGAGSTVTSPVVEAGGDPEPGDPDGGPDFPITANTDEDYPLEPMVDLAVRLVRAEITGEGRDRYPHLDGSTDPPCCRDLVVNGATVRFSEAPEDPATITVDWQATGPNGETVASLTETRWWWSDGTWLAEYEREGASR